MSCEVGLRPASMCHLTVATILAVVGLVHLVGKERMSIEEVILVDIDSFYHRL